MKCPVCKCKGPHKEHLVQPVMYGGRNAIDYLHCINCGVMFKLIEKPKPMTAEEKVNHHTLVEMGKIRDRYYPKGFPESKGK